MAAFCPNCSYKLSMIDIKPECPVCGVNLVYYKMEETLAHEADLAEFEHAANQPMMDRIKAATIQHPLAIVRLVFSILPLVALLVPMGKVVVNLPFFSEPTSISLISVITKVFMALDFDHMLAMLDSSLAGKAYVFYLVALVGLILTIVATIVNIVNIFFSFGKNGIKRNIITAAVGIGCTIIGTVGLVGYLSSLTAAVPEVFTGTFNVLGPVCVILTFVLQIVINVVFKKKNIQVKYKDMSIYLLPYEERSAILEAQAEEKAAEEKAKADEKEKKGKKSKAKK